MTCEVMNAGAIPVGNPNFMSNPYWLLTYYNESGHRSEIYEDEAEAIEHYDYVMKEEYTNGASLIRCFKIR